MGTLRQVQEHFDVGVIVGRFQVDQLHPIHRDLIETVIAAHDRVIVLLGVAPVPGTVENPLNFEARRQMIWAAYPTVEIFPLDDHWSDGIWSAQLDTVVHKVVGPTQTVVLYGGRDSFIKSYEGSYPHRELVSAEGHSGTAIRKKIHNSIVVDAPSFRAGAIWATNNRFPAPVTCVDVAVIKEQSNELLLGRKTDEVDWRFIGGFVDVADPSFEHTVSRELHEETGMLLNRQLFRYLGSTEIDDWRYRGIKNQKVKTIFYAAFAFGPDHAKAADDIAEVRWFPLDKLPPINKTHQPLLTLLREKL